MTVLTNHPGLGRPVLLYLYVSRQFVQYFLLSATAFVSIYLLVDFFEKIDRLLRAELSLAGWLSYFLFKLPLAFSQILPAAVLLAVILTFGLLSRRRETIAIKCAGLNIIQLLVPLVGLACLLALLLGALQLYLNPWLQRQLNLLWEIQVEKKPPRELVDLKAIWYKGDRTIFHIAEFQKSTRTMLEVRIYVFDRDFHLTQFIAARRARWTGDSWRLEEGMSHVFLDNGEVLSETFAARELKLTERPEDFVTLERRPNEMTASDLSRYIQRLERDGYDSTPYRLELCNRYSLALTPLITILIGASLILRRENSNIPLCLILGIALVFVYWLLHSLSNSLGALELLPVLAAAWAANLIFLLAGVLALRGVAR